LIVLECYFNGIVQSATELFDLSLIYCIILIELISLFLIVVNLIAIKVSLIFIALPLLVNKDVRYVLT